MSEKLEIKTLKLQIIQDLKNSDWEGSLNKFKNKYFCFSRIGSNVWDDYKWTIEVKINEFNNPKINLSDIMPEWHFLLLRWFYVKKSLENSEKRIREKQIVDVSKKFFEKNKDLKRDIKINQLLTNK